MLTISVMIMSTQCFPVRGKVHLSKILCFFPLAMCSMVTITYGGCASLSHMHCFLNVKALCTFVFLDATKSMAPPMPFTFLPCKKYVERSTQTQLQFLYYSIHTGIIQLARSPNWDTCIAPRIVTSRWPLSHKIKLYGEKML